MTETWPAPELRERRGTLGWLALSAPEDVIHIGVAGATADEARERYEARRHFWAAIGESTGVAKGAAAAKHREDDLDRDERVSMHGADAEEVLRALLRVDPDGSPVDEADEGDGDDK